MTPIFPSLLYNLQYSLSYNYEYIMMVVWGDVFVFDPQRILACELNIFIQKTM